MCCEAIVQILEPVTLFIVLYPMLSRVIPDFIRVLLVGQIPCSLATQETRPEQAGHKFSTLTAAVHSL